VVHVPFKGSGQSVPALIGGQVDCVFAALPSLAGFVKSGRVKLLSMASAKRSPLAPDVPALGATISGFDYAFIIGLLAPKGTPPDVVKRLSTVTAEVSKNKDVINKFETIGVESVGGGSQEYATALREDAQRVESAVRSAKLKFE
jgi:tripartite-type tricarboxylate transporter receptor subunit TctC